MANKDDKTIDVFTEPLTLDDCDLQTKGGRLRGLEVIAKWELSKPMEKIKAIEIIGKMTGDFIERHEVSTVIESSESIDELNKEIESLKIRLGE